MKYRVTVIAESDPEPEPVAIDVRATSYWQALVRAAATLAPPEQSVKLQEVGS